MSFNALGKNALSGVIKLLNHEPVKEGIKYGASSLSFACGLFEIYEIAQILRGKCRVSSEITATDRIIAPSIELQPSTPAWITISNKVIIAAAKISIVLSAGVSRPGVFIISSLAGSVFSAEKLTKVFGPNTLFAVNPWHPRHVVSIAAVILAAPSVIQSVYRFCASYKAPDCKYSVIINDSKVRLMTFFATLTSRPTLHIGSWVFRAI